MQVHMAYHVSREALTVVFVSSHMHIHYSLLISYTDFAWGTLVIAHGMNSSFITYARYYALAGDRFILITRS
jgi:hypothetical protein